MQALVTETLRTESAVYFEITVEKVSAFVGVYSDGRFIVQCNNAAAKLRRSIGKMFRNVEEAVAAYKSPEMKTAINAARASAK